tara:strand:+ start:31888 stop:32742 length:855 start_codon:yes stop_codon:yes gene_type:complete
MKKETSHSEALRYLSVAGGVLALNSVQAQIKYVDLPDTTLNTNNAFFDLNIDEDTLGVVDYRFIQYVDSGSFNINGSFIQAVSNAGNSVLGLDYANYAYPFNLSPGDSIGPGQVFKGAGGASAFGQLALTVDGVSYPNDKFKGAVNGLIGLRFRADRADTIRTFYAWIRVEVAADNKSMTIKDLAWNEAYGEGIKAGEGAPWIGEQEIELPSNLKLQQLADYLQISSAEKQAKLSFYNLQGSLIDSRQIEKGEQKLKLDFLPKGILIAHLEDGSEEKQIKVLIY